jgi:hypothetical protein
VALLRGQNHDFLNYYNAHDETELGELSLEKTITIE